MSTSAMRRVAAAAVGPSIYAPIVAPGTEKHVFISYVHENDTQVDRLCAILDAAQIPFWRDRVNLAPGDNWRAEIKKAIRDGSLVFLACFSEDSRSRTKTHMNEELTLAVEEFRQMPPGHKWLIPVRFDNGPLPEWDLGGGRGLADLNYVDLYGPTEPAAAASLVTTINRIMGDRPLSPAATMAAVAEATDSTRPEMMRVLTKDLLLDGSRRIELDELITQEANRVVGVLKDEAFGAGPIAGTSNQQAGIIAKQAHQAWLLAAPFCASLRIAARWGDPSLLTPWITGLRRMVEASTTAVAGYEALTDLRRLPATFAVVTAAIAAVSDRRWDNFKAVAVDPAVRHARFAGPPVALLELTDPFHAFQHGNGVAALLAYAASQGRTIDNVLAELGEDKHMRSGATPEFNWVFKTLQPLFADQMPDDHTWTTEFERAEVFIGIVAEDRFLTRPVAESGQRWRMGYWFGRAASDMYRIDSSPITGWAYELERDGATWGPIQAGLFGGDMQRADAAIKSYTEQFNKRASERW
ncbi:toll/interleukin-1 receptor domain-containing protein [Nocardioides KLBMP 9356]|uniref:Toll/interleukin-1 receptor domain-containing protein n=1 Tax=Nocardioides potassii TaxID=2911371 RepID=A0ABS9H7V9_9ACTN|nr:toll/interleukin-1 receptor domain-containing protein [Nocardioides potassii]MCF6376339.1 toll/interleukin-1 receptor domain-containing protein [Nocardioides potassii]